MDIKQPTTKHRTNTYSYNGSYIKQRINNNRTTTLGQQPKPWVGEGGDLNACYCTQIFDLDPAVVEVQGMFSSQVSSLYKNVSSLYKILQSVS